MSILDDLQATVAGWLAWAEQTRDDAFRVGDEAVSLSHRVLLLTSDDTFLREVAAAGVSIRELDDAAVDTIQNLQIDVTGIRAFMDPMVEAVRGLRDLASDILGGGVPVAQLDGVAVGFDGKPVEDTVQIQRAGIWIPFVSGALAALALFAAISVAFGFVNSWADPLFEKVTATAEQLIAAGRPDLAAKLSGQVALAIAETQEGTSTAGTLALVGFGTILTVIVAAVVLKPGRQS